MRGFQIEWAGRESGAGPSLNLRPSLYLVLHSVYPRPLNETGFYSEPASIWINMVHTHSWPQYNQVHIHSNTRCWPTVCTHSLPMNISVAGVTRVPPPLNVQAHLLVIHYGPVGGAGGPEWTSVVLRGRGKRDQEDDMYS